MFEKDPRTFSPEYKNLSPEQKAMVKLEITLTNFFKQFDKSVGRWERMVYPALLIFGILGLSGFYLILNVTDDMHTVAQNVDPMMESNLDAMSKNMSELSKNIAVMTSQLTILVGEVKGMGGNIAKIEGRISEITTSIDGVSNSMDVMTTSVVAMTDSVAGMATSVGEMNAKMADLNYSTKVMTGNVGNMSRDMRIMNDNVSRPMNFMNSFAPW
jgi:methyl-accepting chemotaxis protein